MSISNCFCARTQQRANNRVERTVTVRSVLPEENQFGLKLLREGVSHSSMVLKRKRPEASGPVGTDGGTGVPELEDAEPANEYERQRAAM